MCVVYSMPKNFFNHICNPCPVMVDTVRSLPPEPAGQKYLPLGARDTEKWGGGGTKNRILWAINAKR